MRVELLRQWFGISLLLALFPSVSPIAQIADPPPELPTVDENGVSIPEGINMTRHEAVKIGPESGGLRLVTYINGRSGRSSLIGDLRVYSDGASVVLAQATFDNQSDIFISEQGGNVYTNSRSKMGNGASLSGNSTTPIYTTSNGTRIFYKSSSVTTCGCYYYVVDKVEYPDGEVWSWSWKTLSGSSGQTVRIQSVVNNRGYQIKIKYKSNAYSSGPPPQLSGEFDSVYAVNNAYDYCSPDADDCTFSLPWPTASYSVAYSPTRKESIVDPIGGLTENRWHAQYIFIKTPSSLSENINYKIADWYQCWNDIDTLRVESVTRDGRTWTYARTDTDDCDFHPERKLTVTDPNLQSTVYWFVPRSLWEPYSSLLPRMPYGSPFLLTKVVDPLGRATQYEYDSSFRVKKIISPELDSWENVYDDRGNRLSVTRRAKPGSGLADMIVESRTYPSTCTNPKTCNKPSTVTDANGNVQSFTYDAAHGGVLTESAPSVGGVVAVKRYSYVQRYAWMKNAAGAYVQAPSPIWLLDQQRFCRTTATVGNGCAGGTADEVIKTYDYGPNSGPNNLLLRGQVLTASGASVRTCYGYDTRGNVISTTSPRAALTSCP